MRLDEMGDLMMGDLIVPGDTAFTRIPRLAYSFAAVDPNNNQNLELDLPKMATCPERYRHVFAPGFRAPRQHALPGGNAVRPGSSV
jgi:hypothetical protein